MKTDMKTALFPGTFDPFTLGHASVVHRGLQLFDRIVIAIGVNNDKNTYFNVEERINQIRACYKSENRVEVCSYEGLTVDCAKINEANVILRGVRSLMDFEYERLLSDINYKISNMDTVCFFTEPELASIQSNVVRDLLKHKQDVTAFVPLEMANLLKK
jgi:pantetheine-phosphate adenylyltransferase